MESKVRTIRSYKKTPTIQVPAVPDHISPFLSQSATSSTALGASPLDPSSPDDLLALSPTSSLSPLGSPFNMHFNLGESSSQQRLIQPPQNAVQKLEAKFKRMEMILGNWGFDSIGEFCSTTPERTTLEVLLMVWLSPVFFREKQR